MKPYFLLPGYFKIIGWLLLVPGLILGWLFLFLHFELTVANRRYKIELTSSDFTNELALVLVLVGVYSIIYAKRNDEHEIINSIRLNALWGAFLINYLTVSLIIPLHYLINIEVYNLFSMPLLALIIFQYQLSRYRSKAVFKSVRLLRFYPYQIIAFVTLCTAIGVFIVAYIVTGETDQFFALPLFTMFWICCAEKEEDIISLSRLKIIRNLFTLQLLVTLFCNFYLYHIDFLIFMVINVFALPLLYVPVYKTYYKIKLLKKKNVKHT